MSGHITRHWIYLVSLGLTFGCGSSSSNGPPSAAGASSIAGSANSVSTGGAAANTSGAGSISNAGGASDSGGNAAAGNSSFPAPTTQNCQDLDRCCLTLADVDIPGCREAASFDYSEPCLRLLSAFHSTNDCVGIGGDLPGEGGTGGTGGTGGSVGNQNQPPVFGRGFQTYACTTGNECFAYLAPISDCAGVASTSCSFQNVSICCLFANAEFCYYNLSDDEAFQKAQDCQARIGNWNPTP
ncbi:MAG TPA: hypothetical protein VER96_34040 [Polyangiaceae bacterium]|nr:hypothetical protein [Polyangiaceae bacterium]